ncbi:MAG: leucine-rich repeat domain-containing protein [Myxococcales bacterium]|nr:leucine-rich repeat domain-containing protein [Myxococcales bacterium]
MSDLLALQLRRDDGSVEQQLVPISETALVVRFFFVVLCAHALQQLRFRRLVGLSDNVAQLTRVAELSLDRNTVLKIPAGVLAMTQLTSLTLSDNMLVAIPPEIGRLRALTRLDLERNEIVALPRELGLLRELAVLLLGSNELRSLPSELGQLSALQLLGARRCSLAWLPLALDRLPAWTVVQLNGNPLPIDVGHANAFPATNWRPKLPELFAATTALSMIREPAFDVLVGLAELDLPALLQVDILDAAFPNSIPMYKKWDLVVAVKHFKDVGSA